MTFTEDDLRKAARQVEQEWEESIDREYGSLPEHHFSKRFERRMKRLIQEQSRTPQEKKFISITKKVAAVFLIVLFGVAITTVSVGAYRERFMKYIAKITRRSTDYDFAIATDKYYCADLTKTVYGYIPNGFVKKSEVHNSDMICQVEFSKDDEDYYLDFTVLTKDSAASTSIDTEGSELSEITVRGEDAILNIKNGYCTLIWSRRNVLCQLYGKIDKEEAIRIAENIEIFFLDEMK